MGAAQDFTKLKDDELSTGTQPGAEAHTYIHRRDWKRMFESVTGYGPENFQSFSNFTKWLHRPVDASGLAVFRISYGVAMLLDLGLERPAVHFNPEETDEDFCFNFPLFDFFTRPQFLAIGYLYLLMFLGAVGIALGYRFRLSCFLYIVPYWYHYLGDTQSWNNHSYLFGLTGTLLLFSQANNYCYRGATSGSTVPYWNYFLIKFQFFLLYMYAGLKKLSAEWLSGYSMEKLSEHWVFTPFCMVLTPELVSFLIVHWFTAFFDFSIAFWMTCEKTRLYATPFMLSFHLMNSRLFQIGMFPYVCLLQVPMFFGFDWPKRLLDKIQSKKYFQKKCDKCVPSSNAATSLPEEPETSEKPEEPPASDLSTQPTKGQLWRTIAILAYCALQLFLPYSHFITKGYNSWTEGLYGYSWDMMVHSWSHGGSMIAVVDHSNDITHFFEGRAFARDYRWAHNPFSLKQYALCVERILIANYLEDPEKSQLFSTNISIYMDVWFSMNKRPMQRIVDPRVDLLKAEWSPFQQTSWILPLLDDFTHMRPKFDTIEKEVFAWSNYSDVLFLADFPGLTYTDYLSPYQTNGTLTVLEGNVRYKTDDEVIFLRPGQSCALKTDTRFEIKTLGPKPSSLVLTHVNTTMLGTDAECPKLPFRNFYEEFIYFIQGYHYFAKNVAKCLTIIIYDMPIKAFTYVFQRKLEELEMAKYELPASCPLARL